MIVNQSRSSELQTSGALSNPTLPSLPSYTLYICYQDQQRRVSYSARPEATSRLMRNAQPPTTRPILHDRHAYIYFVIVSLITLIFSIILANRGFIIHLSLLTCNRGFYPTKCIPSHQFITQPTFRPTFESI